MQVPETGRICSIRTKGDIKRYTQSLVNACSFSQTLLPYLVTVELAQSLALFISGITLYTYNSCCLCKKQKLIIILQLSRLLNSCTRTNKNILKFLHAVNISDDLVPQR